VRRADERGDVLVIVDVLSFSTAVVTAVGRGAYIYPCSSHQRAAKVTAQVGGEAAVRRTEVPTKGRFSLSPLTFEQVEPGTKVAVASPNGAACARHGRRVPFLLAGCLLNAAAVSKTVAEILARTDLAVTVIACGERERLPAGKSVIRWAVEDYLGAGAILSHLPYDKSPDAVVCEGAFQSCREIVGKIITGCESGRELVEWGFGGDVEFAVRFNVSDCVPVLKGGRFEPFDPSDCQ
jgi:2-phosphosulfolactate phosphatase